MFNRKGLKLIAFLVIGLFAGFGTSFAENEVIVNDVTYNGTYPPYGIDITITTSIKIKGTPNLILEYDNPGVKYMISARIDSCGDVGCFGKIKYDKELPTGKYIGKIIFSYQKSDSSERYTATGSYTLDIIQPDFEEDGVSVNDIIFNDIIAGYKHKKLQPVVIKNDTEKRVVITSISVKSDMLGIEDMFKGTLQAEEIGILEYNGVLNAGTYTGKLVVGYGEKFGQEIDQATGLITINVIPINNISELTSTNIDFGQIEWGYEDIDEKVITVINPTDSEIVIKGIRLDTSDNPNINEVFEVLDSENFTILGPKEAIDFATVTMKKGLHLGLYTGKVEIIYQKDDKEYSIRSYLTGNIVGKETIDELILTGSLPKDGTKFGDYQFNPIFNKDYVTLKNYELFAYDENAGDGGNWVKVEDPEHVFNTSAEYSLRMYMEISDSYTIGENTDITYYFDRFSWEDGYDFDSGIRFYDCHFGNDSFVINISSNNEDYGIVSTSRTKARYGEYITLTATPKDGYRFKEWQTENDIEINDNGFNMIDEDVLIQAIFEAIPTPTPSYSGGGGSRGRSVSKSEDNKKVDEEVVEKNEENKEENNTNKSELELAYEFAYKNGITTMDTMEKAELDQPLTRIAMAKMLSQYAMNVLGKVPVNKMAPKFDDVTDELNEEYYGGSELAYQLNIMGLNIPDNKFRPFDLVTRAEFITALSRMLYGLVDGTNVYYEPHMDKLASEGVVTDTNPDIEEIRGYVMIMLMRSDKPH